MKTKTKALVLAACAILLVVSTVFATMAFLTSTDTVKNTFTVGKVKITLDEAKVDEYGVAAQGAARVKENTYKLIPGHTYTKDPTIHVEQGSEDCWLFAKIENGLEGVSTLTVNSGWTLIDADAKVYAYGTKVSAKTAAQDVQIFAQFKFNSDANPETYKDKNITVTGYAVQADGFDTANAAWTAVNF